MAEPPERDPAAATAAPDATPDPAPDPERDLPWDVATELAHDPELDPSGAIAPAIQQTSLFAFASYAAMKRAVAGEEARPIYSRGDNPTVQALERRVARLEGAEAARAFASGMGAICAAVLAEVSAGDRIVCVRHVYPDAFKLFTALLPRFGVVTEFVDGRDPEAVIARLDGARLLYLENPTSLVFELQDVAALAAAARERGVTVVIDNSWATPLHQRPLLAGADLVVHSASKYLSGHSDVVAGVVAGSAARIAAINHGTYPLVGAKLAPLEAWLLLRGLRTLPLRMERHAASALRVAEFLAAQPAVARVHCPAHPSHPQRALFARQFRAGSGLLSLELADTDEAGVAAFVDALRLFRPGVSWGGYESLVYPAALGYAAPGASAVRRFGVSPRLVRLHVGLEAPDDLIADLERGFAALERRCAATD